MKDGIFVKSEDLEEEVTLLKPNRDKCMVCIGHQAPIATCKTL